MFDIKKEKQTVTNGRQAVVIFVTGAAFIAVVIIYMLHLAKRPLYNSDILPYMGISLQMQGFDAKQLHKIVYQTAEKCIPPKDYKDLISLNPGRAERYSNYRLFYEYLRFFRLKPFYVFLIRLFNIAGINLVFATILPSLIFTAGLLIAFYFGILQLFRQAIPAFATAIIVMLLSVTNQLTCLSSPDAMSSFFVFLLFLNVFFNQKEWVSYTLLALCIFTRIDNLTLLPFILYYYRINKINTKSAVRVIVAIAILSAVVIITPYFFGNSPFWFKDFIFKPSVYVSLAVKSAALFRTDFNLLFVLAFVFFYCMLTGKSYMKKFITGVLLAVALRFLLFPSYEERFYFVYKLILIFLLLAEISVRIKRKEVNDKNFITSIYRNAAPVTCASLEETC